MDDQVRAPYAQEREILRAYRAVFCNPAGQAVLRNLESMCRAKHTITDEEANGAPIDPVRLHIQEGKRRVFWQIMATVAAAEALAGEE